MDLAAGALTSVPHRVVTFAARCRARLAVGGVDRRRVEWVVPGGVAEPGVAGVRFGAGHGAGAISMLVWPRYGCGVARPGLFQRQAGPALRVPGQLRLGPPATPAPHPRDIAWRRENAAVALER